METKQFNISDVEYTDAIVQDFLAIPEQVYKSLPNIVIDGPEIEFKRLKALTRHPAIGYVFYDHEPFARIILIFTQEACQFACFEIIESHIHLVNEVFDTIESTAFNHKRNRIWGPKLDNLVVGLQSKGFHLPNSIATSYHPSYYLRLFEQAGYRVSNTILTYTVSRADAEFVIEQLPVTTTEYSLRSFSKENLDQEVKIFNNLNQQIFGHERDYEARSLEEEMAFVQSFLPFIDEELIIMAFDYDLPIGFVIALPDYNQMRLEQKLSRIRVISIGVLPEYRKQGVGNLLVTQLIENALQSKKYEEAELSWIYEDNYAPQALIAKYLPKKGREFVLLQKEIRQG